MSEATDRIVVIIQVCAITWGDKLQTNRDVYLEEKLIPAGTFFYICHDPVKICSVSGFGANLTMGVAVTSENPMNREFNFSKAEIIILPLDCLQLVDSQDRRGRIRS